MTEGQRPPVMTSRNPSWKERDRSLPERRLFDRRRFCGSPSRHEPPCHAAKYAGFLSMAVFSHTFPLTPKSFQALAQLFSTSQETGCPSSYSGIFIHDPAPSCP